MSYKYTEPDGTIPQPKTEASGWRLGSSAKDDDMQPDTAKPESPKHEPRTHTIIVNGRAATVEVNEVSYEQILLIAYPNPETGPNVRYRITWARSEHGEATGKLVPGETVKVNEGMIFNVKRANKS